MVLFISVLASTVAAVAFIGALVRAGFRHADVPEDVRVRARTLPVAGAGAPGRWVEVTITNPSAATALVALTVGRARLAWAGATTHRSTARPRTRLSLVDRTLGVVPGGESAEFHLWAEGQLRSLRLRVAVGTPGRLRLHRMPLPAPDPDGGLQVGMERFDPRTPVAP